MISIQNLSFAVIDDFNSTIKEFTIKQYEDERGQIFPAENTAVFQVAAGDTYVLSDIMLPQIYINMAASKLRTKAIEEYEKYASPLVTY